MNSSDTASTLKLANIEFSAGNYAKSIDLYRKAMALDPELSEIALLNIAIAQECESDDTLIDLADASHSVEVVAHDSARSLNAELETITSSSHDSLTIGAEQPAEAILVQPARAPCQRLLKQYDTFQEEAFLKKIATIPLDSKKLSRKYSASIIMPTYNRSATLKAAINSVISQSHKLWELIIIDDGSTDDTPQILKSFKKDKRIKVIKGDHKGVSAARNQGLEVATGDYIYYLDSDNTWRSNFLEVMNLSFLLTGRETGYSSLLLHDEHSNIIGYRGEPFDWDECLKANYVDINVFAHKRSLLINEGPFDISLRRMVDWDLILRYTKTSPPYFAPFIGCDYLESKNDTNRITLSEPLAFQKVVRSKNTLANASKHEIAKNIALRIAIKIPAPEAEKEQWGDYHYADSLRIALEKKGHSVVLDFHGAWYSRPANSEDVVIVIRGLTSYKPRKGTINVVWNISHPDQISIDEYESFDFVYVASGSYADFLKFQLNTKVSPLLQCSDPHRFKYVRPTKPRAESMLFVGNSRNEYRPIVKKAIESGRDIAIYGTRWEKLVDPGYVRAENISNTVLCSTYAAHSVVLNDHWESMRDYGFVSNRVFDVTASGSTLITDPIASIGSIFGDTVVQLDDAAGFDSVALQLANIEDFGEHRKRSVAAYVNKYHSFDNRANIICDDVLVKLGLTSIWSSDPSLDAGCSSFEPLAPKLRVGLFLETDKPLNQAQHVRIISPLTSESAFQTVQLTLITDLKQLANKDFDAVIVQNVAIHRKSTAVEIIAHARNNDFELYVDVCDDFLTPSGKKATVEQKASLKLLMSNAVHVWFSTNRLQLSLCGTCRSSSVIPYSLDKRFWRNYRQPQPKPALAPRFRFLILADRKTKNDIKHIVNALDMLVHNRGSILELVIIGELDFDIERTWIKHIRPHGRRAVYPNYAEWLMKAEKFDIGLIPKLDPGADIAENDEDFLQMTALGMPVICSRSWVYESVAKSGLVIATSNTIEKWANCIAMAMDHPEIMITMADRAWRHVWQYRTAAATGVNLVNNLHQTDVTILPLPKSKIATKSRNAVCLHLYYVEQWPQISSRLKNITEPFDLFVTCTFEDHKLVEGTVGKDYSQAIIAPVENSGMDVLPFLSINREYSLWRYAAVLKLHTKNTKTADDLIFGNLCYESLLPSAEGVNSILRKLKSDPDVGIFGPEPLYRSAQSLMYVNGPYVRDILDILEIKEPNYDWGFFAGTMFWIQGSLLHTLAQNFTELVKLAQIDSSIIKSGGDGSWAHAMERVFGALPNSKGMKNQLIFLSDFRSRDWSARSITDGEFVKSLSYRVSSKWHLGRFANIERWSQLCLDSDLFDEVYYQENSGGTIPPGMRPVVHYILYGDDVGLDPSAEFSTSYYKARHPDTLNARVPLLVHYLVCGVKEGRSICAANQY